MANLFSGNCEHNVASGCRSLRPTPSPASLKLRIDGAFYAGHERERHVEFAAVRQDGVFDEANAIGFFRPALGRKTKIGRQRNHHVTRADFFRPIGQEAAGFADASFDSGRRRRRSPTA